MAFYNGKYKSVITQGRQYQVVTGNRVSNLFHRFKKLGKWYEAASKEPAKSAGNIFQRLFSFVPDTRHRLHPLVVYHHLSPCLLQPLQFSAIRFNYISKPKKSPFYTAFRCRYRLSSPVVKETRSMQPQEV